MEDLISLPVVSQRVLSLDRGAVELVVGEKVLALLADLVFQRGWDTLYAACPWGTVFQSREFVSTWYRIYGSEYQPILLKAVTGGRLTGLLTLAQDRSGLIMGAGASQAEYQVWLTIDTIEDHFIKNALFKIWESFPGNDIRLKYIPGTTPLGWIERDKVWSKRCVLRAFPQPLLRIDDALLSQELHKKNRREKINRLKRMGALKFERVTDALAFTAIFDELASQYDFRKGAMFNKTFFQEDPLRKEFLLALFQEKLLHATVLKLNEEIIASNVGVSGKNWVHLQGINTHSPLYARYSPGILHFLMLGKLLAEEGMEVFDLTPGADSYKEGLATEHTLAYEFSFGSIYSQVATNLKNKLLYQIKKNSSRVGVQPTVLRKWKKEISLFKERLLNTNQQGLMALITGIFAKARPAKKVKLYRIQPEAALPPGKEPINITRGSLPDLLDFDQKGARLTRWEFLADAMHRLEDGSQAFTWSERGRLKGCAWQSAMPPSLARNYLSEEVLEGALVLEGFYIHPNAKDRWQAFLASVTKEAAKGQEGGWVYAVARAGDADLCHSLKELGFQEVPESEVPSEHKIEPAGKRKA